MSFLSAGIQRFSYAVQQLRHAVQPNIPQINGHKYNIEMVDHCTLKELEKLQEELSFDIAKLIQQGIEEGEEFNRLNLLIGIVDQRMRQLKREASKPVKNSSIREPVDPSFHLHAAQRACQLKEPRISNALAPVFVEKSLQQAKKYYVVTQGLRDVSNGLINFRALQGLENYLKSEIGQRAIPEPLDYKPYLQLVQQKIGNSVQPLRDICDLDTIKSNWANLLLSTQFEKAPHTPVAEHYIIELLKEIIKYELAGYERYSSFPPLILKGSKSSLERARNRLPLSEDNQDFSRDVSSPIHIQAALTSSSLLRNPLYKTYYGLTGDWPYLEQINPLTYPHAMPLLCARRANVAFKLDQPDGGDGDRRDQENIRILEQFDVVTTRNTVPLLALCETVQKKEGKDLNYTSFIDKTWVWMISYSERYELSKKDNDIKFQKAYAHALRQMVIYLSMLDNLDAVQVALTRLKTDVGIHYRSHQYCVQQFLVEIIYAAKAAERQFVSSPGQAPVKQENDEEKS